jgi:hypothetical protein
LIPTWQDLEKIPLEADVVSCINQVCQPESEWIRRAENDLLVGESIFPEGAVLLIVDGQQKVFAGLPEPLFHLGTLSEGLASLYEAYVERRFPGAPYFRPSCFSDLACRYGDPANERLHKFQSVWHKWVDRMSLPA